MADVISLNERRDRRAAEDHARALVVFECASRLARQSHPGLLSLIEESFGPSWVEERVRDTLTPQRMASAPKHAGNKRRPAR